MSVKLLMHWDIRPGRDQEYFEFVVREWVPGIQKLGLQPTGAWYTVYSRSKDAPGVPCDLDTPRRPGSCPAVREEEPWNSWIRSRISAWWR